MKFAQRHIGISNAELKDLLAEIKANSISDLISQTIPAKLINPKPLGIGEAMTEQEYLGHIKDIGKKNKPFKTYIGMGYYDTVTPSVILRNIFENPGWYTQYTPYQAEISQGRLESLLNYQTMICDLTGMPIANASLLDEATATAEAMYMFFNAKNKSDVVANKFLVDDSVFPQTKAVLKTKAEHLGIEIVESSVHQTEFDTSYFGALIQNPAVDGFVLDFTKKILLENKAVIKNGGRIYTTKAKKFSSEGTEIS